MSNYKNSSRVFNDEHWPKTAEAIRITIKNVNLERLISGVSPCRDYWDVYRQRPVRKPPDD
jgi:hypothetical protein